MFQPNLLKRPIKAKNRWALLVVLVLLYGCAGSEMAAGRQALLMGKPDVALKDFQRVAETDPNYVMRFVVLTRESGLIWGERNTLQESSLKLASRSKRPLRSITMII
jgi:hypothetical protein